MTALTTRKLASIQRIKALEPIANADAIERATVLGWQLVVKKGEFAVGDLCVYCEIDALLPERPEFEFLRPRKSLIRTVRLRGQRPEGTRPGDLLPPRHPARRDTHCGGGGRDRGAGDRQVRAAPARADRRGREGALPPLRPQDRRDARAGAGGGAGAAARADALRQREARGDEHDLLPARRRVWGLLAESGVARVARQRSLVGRATPRHRGEAAAARRERRRAGGVGRRGHPEEPAWVEGVHFFAFSLFDIDRYAFFDYAPCMATARDLGLETAPVVTDRFVLTDGTGVAEIVAFATGRSAVSAQAWREGLVFRPLVETSDPELGRLSFKAINPEYLLKHGE